MKKNLINALVLGLVLSLGTAVVNVPNSTVAVAEANSAASTGVHWSNGSKAEIVAVGFGLAPEKASKAKAYVLARRAAIVDGYRMLAEFCEGLDVDADTTVKDMMIENDVVKTNVSALIKGAEIMEEGWNTNGSYYVVLKMPVFGYKSLASAVMPALLKEGERIPVARVDFNNTTLNDVEYREFKNNKEAMFTSVVVDASGLGLEAAFSPIIYDSKGRAIYGVKNIDKDYAISQGMVQYASDVNNLSSCDRAGQRPMIIKAVSVKGGPNSVNKVNVVVSPADGDRILLANENSGMLEKCKVIFVK